MTPKTKSTEHFYWSSEYEVVPWGLDMKQNALGEAQTKFLTYDTTWFTFCDYSVRLGQGRNGKDARYCLDEVNRIDLPRE